MTWASRFATPHLWCVGGSRRAIRSITFTHSRFAFMRSVVPLLSLSLLPAFGGQMKNEE
jgi:hypothetical protein